MRILPTPNLGCHRPSRKVAWRYATYHWFLPSFISWYVRPRAEKYNTVLHDKSILPWYCHLRSEITRFQIYLCSSIWTGIPPVAITFSISMRDTYDRIVVQML